MRSLSARQASARPGRAHEAYDGLLHIYGIGLSVFLSDDVAWCLFADKRTLGKREGEVSGGSK